MHKHASFKMLNDNLVHRHGDNRLESKRKCNLFAVNLIEEI